FLSSNTSRRRPQSSDPTTSPPSAISDSCSRPPSCATSSSVSRGSTISSTSYVRKPYHLLRGSDESGRSEVESDLEYQRPRRRCKPTSRRRAECARLLSTAAGRHRPPSDYPGAGGWECIGRKGKGASPPGRRSRLEAAAVGHRRRCGLLLVLGNVRDQPLGGQEQRRDRRRFLERDPLDLGRVENPRLHHVHV